MGASNSTPRTPTAVMRLLRSIVTGGPETPSNQEPNAVLRFLQSQRADEDSDPAPARDTQRHSDPVREAAMNHIRRLRIHAA